MLAGSGRAGDLTVRFGTSDGVEDTWHYFKKAIDTPAFARFAATLAVKSGPSSAARRKCSAQRQAAAAIAADAADVEALGSWETAVFGEP